MLNKTLPNGLEVAQAYQKPRMFLAGEAARGILVKLAEGFARGRDADWSVCSNGYFPDSLEVEGRGSLNVLIGLDGRFFTWQYFNAQRRIYPTTRAHLAQQFKH